MYDLKEFYKTDIYKKVIGDFDHVYEDPSSESNKDWFKQTRVWDYQKITSIEPFYYIWKVQQTANNKKVLDYGCGANFFKTYWPNIHGVDKLSFSDGSFFPLPDEISKDYINTNKETFFGIIAICSLHFIEKDSIISYMNKLLDMLSSGCRAYMTFNTARISEASNEPFSAHELGKVISTHYSHKDFKIIEMVAREPMGFLGKDGNVKVLLEKV